MCLAFFIFFFLSERINIGIYIAFTFLSKSSFGSIKPACTISICGCQDNCENNKSNMTLTSLTGKSLKPTWGAKWCCLCLSQCVTDKHHAGSINRLIVLSLLPIQCTQTGWVVGVFVKLIDKIHSISETHNRRHSVRPKCAHKSSAHTPKHIQRPFIAGHTAPYNA